MADRNNIDYIDIIEVNVPRNEVSRAVELTRLDYRVSTGYDLPRTSVQYDYSGIDLIAPEGGSPVFINLTIDSITINPTSIIITFSDDISLAGDATIPGNWVITPSGGAVAVTVIGLSVVGADLTLTTTEATIGGSYSLGIPIGVYRTIDGYPLLPPYAQAYTGEGTAPTVSQIVVLNDARTFDVVFSESVLTAEALLKANYGVSPLLTVDTVTKVQDNRYTITTLEAQIPGQLYTVTVSNVHDLYGNLI